MGKTTGSVPFRRSTRVNVGCRVRISGTLEDNAPFEEETQVVTVSKYGAKLRTQIPLQVGMQLKVKPLRGKRAGVFKVVWVGRNGTPRAGEVGVEYGREVAEILGVNFPETTAPAR